MTRTCHALIVSAMLAMAGCASPATRILTSANGYHYHFARYSETCNTPMPLPNGVGTLAIYTTPSACDEKAESLRRWHTALGEANGALQRGGNLPLQLDALKQVEKGTKKWQR